MPVDYAEVLAELEAEEGRLMTELHIIKAAKPAIQAMLQRTAPNAAKYMMGRFAGMGATEAIPLLLAGLTIPMTYREIHDALKAEGWTTTSSDSAATVSATLSQLKGDYVEKVGSGWRLMQPTVPTSNSDPYEESGITDDDIPF